MDEKMIQYLSSLNTDNYTATDEEISRTYKSMLELEKSETEDKHIIQKRNIDTRCNKARIWKYAVPLSASVIFILAVLAISGLLNNGTLQTTNTQETGNPTTFASTTHPGTTPNSTTTANTTTSMNTIVCRVQLSLNPSVEFQLAENLSVINVVGLNDDGTALIEGIDFYGLSFENATIIVVNRLISENYINASTIEDNIYLSVSGETGHKDVLAVMTNVLRIVAWRYDLSLDTVKTDDNQVKIVVANNAVETSASESTTEPSTTNTDKIPSTLHKLELTLTGKKYPYSEVDSVFITFEDGVEHMFSDIFTSYDLAGDTIGFTTFWSLHVLIEQGYFSDISDNRILFSLPGCDDTRLAKVVTLANLMFNEAGLALDVERTGAGKLTIKQSDLPAPERTAKYTMSEIMDYTYIKTRADVTDEQVQILVMAFGDMRVEEILAPRYWAIIPNLIGLTEEEAIKLCKLAGLVPVAHRVYRPEETSVEVGRVYHQDSTPGGTWEVGTNFLFFVKTDQPEPSGIIKY
jgi:hypothetical protein